MFYWFYTQNLFYLFVIYYLIGFILGIIMHFKKHYNYANQVIEKGGYNVHQSIGQ